MSKNKYLISADSRAQQDMSDGAPLDSYYGYEYESRSTAGIVVSCTRREADRMAREFRKTWREQGHDVTYTVERVAK